MIQTVVKRDGRIVGFNENKIGAAIRKAMLSTQQGEDGDLIVKITDRISIRGKSQMTVEEIQEREAPASRKTAAKGENSYDLQVLDHYLDRKPTLKE